MKLSQLIHVHVHCILYAPLAKNTPSTLNFIYTRLFNPSLLPSLVSQGDLRPDGAANLLTIFEGKFTRLKEDRDNIIKAKEALELAEPGEHQDAVTAATLADVCTSPVLHILAQ